MRYLMVTDRYAVDAVHPDEPTHIYDTYLGNEPSVYYAANSDEADRWIQDHPIFGYRIDGTGDAMTPRERQDYAWASRYYASPVMGDTGKQHGPMSPEGRQMWIATGGHRLWVMKHESDYDDGNTLVNLTLDPRADDGGLSIRILNTQSQPTDA